jgi:hypothetical protein
MRTAVGRIRVKSPGRVASGVAVVLFLSSAGLVHAQGLGGLSKLLGGGGMQHSHYSGQSGQSDTAVTVQRSAAPYTGEFTGKERTTSGPHSLSSRFVCYPARDPAFAQTEAFLCYAPDASAD